MGSQLTQSISQAAPAGLRWPGRAQAGLRAPGGQGPHPDPADGCSAPQPRAEQPPSSIPGRLWALGPASCIHGSPHSRWCPQPRSGVRPPAPAWLHRHEPPTGEQGSRAPSTALRPCPLHSPLLQCPEQPRACKCLKWRRPGGRDGFEASAGLDPSPGMMAETRAAPPARGGMLGSVPTSTMPRAGDQFGATRGCPPKGGGLGAAQGRLAGWGHPGLAATRGSVPAKDAQCHRGHGATQGCPPAPFHLGVPTGLVPPRARCQPVVPKGLLSPGSARCHRRCPMAWCHLGLGATGGA